MKAKRLGQAVCFEPENTWDAFQLGQVYEKTREVLEPGVTTESDKKGFTNGIAGIRFDAGEIIGYLLSKP